MPGGASERIGAPPTASRASRRRRAAAPMWHCRMTTTTALLRAGRVTDPRLSCHSLRDGGRRLGRSSRTGRGRPHAGHRALPSPARIGRQRGAACRVARLPAIPILAERKPRPEPRDDVHSVAAPPGHSPARRTLCRDVYHPGDPQHRSRGHVAVHCRPRRGSRGIRRHGPWHGRRGENGLRAGHLSGSMRGGRAGRRCRPAGRRDRRARGHDAAAGPVAGRLSAVLHYRHRRAYGLQLG